jgi:hypothetical protein
MTHILKSTNQDPSEWFDDPNYGKFVYVSDFPHDENNYYGLSDVYFLLNYHLVLAFFFPF